MTKEEAIDRINDDIEAQVYDLGVTVCDVDVLKIVLSIIEEQENRIQQQIELIDALQQGEEN